MNNKYKQIIEVTDKKVNEKNLTEDIIDHIHDFTKNDLKPRLEEIYKIFNDIEILRNIPLVNCV